MTSPPLPAEILHADWPAGLARAVGAEPAPGGWVATTWLVRLADGRDAVAKLTPYPADDEVDGLTALAAAGVPVPRVYGHAGGTLVMERVGGPADWEAVGRGVAAMHQTIGPRYGWHRDNRAGKFVQPNAWADDWPTFFVERRVRVHLDDPLVPQEFRLRLQRACDGPIPERLPPHPAPALTHGDLWTGNVVAGRWVVDPEVSFAARELDLAYMQMSVRDPFPDRFWGAYRELAPIPGDFPERRRILELHHRLLNVRHFGDRAMPGLVATMESLGW